ncbi:MAG: hypothetical protein GXO77_11050, partial [Calditrichaeota bacterium]|nr:hypothetical protein [Calditrichota bacterium]
MNKFLISNIIIGIIVVTLGASCTLQESDTSRDSFFEVHLEPNGANNDMFNNLSDFVKLADSYGGKEFEKRQNSVPCPEYVRASEKYLGDMNDNMKLLSKLGE